MSSTVADTMKLPVPVWHGRGCGLPGVPACNRFSLAAISAGSRWCRHPLPGMVEPHPWSAAHPHRNGLPVQVKECGGCKPGALLRRIPADRLGGPDGG